jgi:hypothetical protein
MMNTASIFATLPLYPIFDAYIPIGHAEYEQIEVRFGCSVPDDLRSMFSDVGCAGFEEAAFFSQGAHKFPVAFLFGGGHSSYSVTNNMDSYSDELPSGMLPFAGDEFGNLFCLSSGAVEAPGIYRWDHEIDSSRGRNPLFLTSDLERFLGAIRIQ